MRVVIRSRIGNTTLALLGLLYVVSASATLIYYIVTNWGANHITDLILQAALVAAAIGGVFFVLIGFANLGWGRLTAGQQRAPELPPQMNKQGHSPIPS